MFRGRGGTVLILDSIASLSHHIYDLMYDVSTQNLIHIYQIMKKDSSSEVNYNIVVSFKQKKLQCFSKLCLIVRSWMDYR